MAAQQNNRNDRIDIDLGSIPDHVRNDLARATISYVKEYYSDPGNEARYQEWLKERKRRPQPDCS